MYGIPVNHIWSMLHSYRNQSIDLQCKSIEWFLFENNTGVIWVKEIYYSAIHHKVFLLEGNL